MMVLGGSRSPSGAQPPGAQKGIWDFIRWLETPRVTPFQLNSQRDRGRGQGPSHPARPCTQELWLRSGGVCTPALYRKQELLSTGWGKAESQRESEARVGPDALALPGPSHLAPATPGKSLCPRGERARKEGLSPLPFSWDRPGREGSEVDFPAPHCRSTWGPGA